MFKINKLTDYSTVVMSYLAEAPEAVHNANDICQHTHITLPTVSKILKMLAKANLLTSHRGAAGGYQLAKPPQNISIAEIVMAIEGEVGLTECSMDHSHCSIQDLCHIRGNWRLISHIVQQTLQNITLADLAKPMLATDMYITAIGATQTKGD